ncbi:MAG: hypothetical protein BGO31_12890 [Bacteroidetes bacterium 43-16]|nr:MAG: hypothetical protein BGO31_12890 [Bacteroidetes bacterium 43-16]
MVRNRKEKYDEIEMLFKLQEGDKKAYGQLFLSHYSSLCLFAEPYVGEESAEDVVEDVFLKLLQSDFSFNDSAHLKAFLYRSVKNGCLDLIKTTVRQSERQFAYAHEADEHEPGYVTHIIQTEAIRLLHQAVNSLPSQTAEVLKLTYLEGMSNQEAADELHVSINTIKTQKQRGLSKLRQILPKDQLQVLLLLFF